MSKPIEEPRPGEGRAYFLALQALSDAELMAAPANSEWHKNLKHALRVFQRMVDSQQNTSDIRLLSNMLHNQFDIDSVITFSDGWAYWESLVDFISGRPAPAPLDQQLFQGLHPKAEAYFLGIDSLASKHATQVVDWLSNVLDDKPLNHLLDLGAGPGTYARALVRSGIASTATCVDFDYVVRLAVDKDALHLPWVASDLFKLEFPGKPSFDLVYIGNVFHHYSLSRGAEMLKRAGQYIDDNAYLAIQEYSLEDWPNASPVYSAVFGLHFALTTLIGRCYSRSEISCIVGESIPGFRYMAKHNLGNSDIILYKRCAT